MNPTPMIEHDIKDAECYLSALKGGNHDSQEEKFKEAEAALKSSTGDEK